jgi:hypothetical protein
MHDVLRYDDNASCDDSSCSGGGRICRIEPQTAGRLSPPAVATLARADVVLYDRSLAPLVAGVLPEMRYAEPLPPDADSDAISPRARQLAADGWHVVQLVAPCQKNLAHPAEGELVIIDPLGPAASAAANAFTANGLAG